MDPITMAAAGIMALAAVSDSAEEPRLIKSWVGVHYRQNDVSVYFFSYDVGVAHFTEFVREDEGLEANETPRVGIQEIHVELPPELELHLGTIPWFVYVFNSGDSYMAKGNNPAITIETDKVRAAVIWSFDKPTNKEISNRLGTPLSISHQGIRELVLVGDDPPTDALWLEEKKLPEW